MRTRKIDLLEKQPSSTVEGEIEDIPFPQSLVKTFALLGSPYSGSMPALNCVAQTANFNVESVFVTEIYEYGVGCIISLHSVEIRLYLTRAL
jgi:hypothetical protein